MEPRGSNQFLTTDTSLSGATPLTTAEVAEGELSRAGFLAAALCDPSCGVSFTAQFDCSGKPSVWIRTVKTMCEPHSGRCYNPRSLTVARSHAMLLRMPRELSAFIACSATTRLHTMRAAFCMHQSSSPAILCRASDWAKPFSRIPSKSLGVCAAACASNGCRSLESS